MTDTTAGLALRSTDRATPLVLLALFMLLGQRPHRPVAPLPRRRPRHRLLVAGLVVANNPSLFIGDTIANNFTQPASLPSLPAGRHRPPERHPSRHPGLRHPGQRLRRLPLGRHRRHAPAAPARPRLRHPRAADHGVDRHGRHALRHGRPDPGRHGQHERPGTDGPPDGRRRPHGRVRPAVRALRGAPAPAPPSSCCRRRWGSPTRSRSASPAPTPRSSRPSTSRTSRSRATPAGPPPSSPTPSRPPAHGPGRVRHGAPSSWRATPPVSTTSPGSAC